MRSFLASIGCCFAVAASLTGYARSTHPATEEQGVTTVTDKLVGTWRLVSVETVRPNGEVIYPFYGRHPEGVLIYDRSGWMSVQIVSDPKPTLSSSSSREGLLAAAPSEKANLVDGYYAYCGTWTVDQSNSTVTHHIKQSLYPAERGTEGVRNFSLDGSRLILVAKGIHEMGEVHKRSLVWERVPSELP
ncbi:lipocalin-like domain-containing protein [Tunturiibacter gelidoferens]|uniref:Lipocalin-like domain-containing protein n=1 Tax=Tunturiibacter gelidiferens TaxID=3069689 RepID=A0AAU7Z0J0_9BACT